MAVASFTASGSKAATPIKLPKEVFAVEVENHELLKQAYVAYQSNSRINLAKALKRGEVRGGGKKPWRQKGTGNARTGSIRNPLWRGGGAIFAPQGIENYSKGISARSKKTSLKQALSLAAKSGKLATIDNFEVKSGKTKDATKLISKLVSDDRVTFVVDNITKETALAVRNLNNVQIVVVDTVNVVDVLDAKQLIITKEAVAALEARLGGDK